MLYNLRKQSEELSLEELDKIEEIERQIGKIESIKEKFKEKVLDNINAIGRVNEGYLNLKNDFNVEDVRRIVYATFKHRSTKSDLRFDSSVNKFVSELIKSMDNESVAYEYRRYDHPYIWNSLLTLMSRESEIWMSPTKGHELVDVILNSTSKIVDKMNRNESIDEENINEYIEEIKKVFASYQK